jgi:hypothetical protein
MKPTGGRQDHPSAERRGLEHPFAGRGVGRPCAARQLDRATPAQSAPGRFARRGPRLGARPEKRVSFPSAWLRTSALTWSALAMRADSPRALRRHHQIALPHRSNIRAASGCRRMERLARASRLVPRRACPRAQTRLLARSRADMARGADARAVGLRDRRDRPRRNSPVRCSGFDWRDGAEEFCPPIVHRATELMRAGTTDTQARPRNVPVCRPSLTPGNAPSNPGLSAYPSVPPTTISKPENRQFAGTSKRLKGLEPSTFCMASRRVWPGSCNFYLQMRLLRAPRAREDSSRFVGF